MAKNIFENFDFEEYRDLLQSAKEDEVHLVHTFDPDYHLGGFTIAWQRDGDFANGKKVGKMINVAVTYCSDEDYFSRKIGARNVLRNAYSGKFIQLPINHIDSEVVVNRLRTIFNV
jgi:hypothetical protein